MDFLKFKKTLDKNKVHVVSPFDEFLHAGLLSFNKTLGDFECEEPCYLLKTSGSGNSKYYLHKLSDVEKSVKSFLDSFPMSSDDRWGLCLSTDHVAGFSILVRSYFANMKEPYVFSWSVESLISNVEENEITVLSLVPTQVFDLVKLNTRSPKGLKHVFVGGAPISRELIHKARSLGWPLVMCYGSTETFAQMSSSQDGVNFRPFKGWDVKLAEVEGFSSSPQGLPPQEVLLKGPSVYFAQLEETSGGGSGLALRTRESEWLFTGDLGSLSEGSFSIDGKLNGLIKIKGSYVNFNDFKKDFFAAMVELAIDDVHPVVLFEERNGAGIYLICSDILPAGIEEPLFKRFTELRGCFKMERVPKTAIGKIDRASLEGVLLRQVLLV